jgi:hypothetical protein
MTSNYKCTWVLHGVKYPPAFSIAKTSGGINGLMNDSTLALSSTNYWIIHHMEYNGAQLPLNESTPGASYTGYYDATNPNLASNKALDVTSKVP